MGAVTWVGVAATHRRQGLLRRLMAACHEDIDARGEPVAMLFASEAGIYERFGYGAATRIWMVEIDTRETGLRPELVPPAGSVRYVVGDEAAVHVADLWERYRRTRPCETSRPQNWLDFYALIRSQERCGASPAWFLAHRDGYAIYRMRERWNDGHPGHELELGEIVALTPEAHVALWHVLLNIDLVGTISTRQLAVDDPLPYLLTNPRAVRTTAMNDGVWANVRDVPTSFAARRYVVRRPPRGRVRRRALRDRRWSGRRRGEAGAHPARPRRRGRRDGTAAARWRVATAARRRPAADRAVRRRPAPRRALLQLAGRPAVADVLLTSVLG